MTGGAVRGSPSTMPSLPPGWRVVDAGGPLGFVTRVTLEDPEGHEYLWTSRRHRKRLGLSTSGRLEPTGVGARPTGTSRWLAALFALGSICFAAGALPAFVNAVPGAVVAWTFVLGSVFFTVAGSAQLHEVMSAPLSVKLSAQPRSRHDRLVGWRPHSIDWWGAIIQLGGMIAFNVSTFAATRSDLGGAQEVRLIWAPDVIGSLCFLVATWLAYAEVNRGVLPRPDRSLGWKIAATNLLGSLAFGVSAVAARYLPGSGEVANAALVNLGTFVGAVFFLVAALALPVESVRDSTERALST